MIGCGLGCLGVFLFVVFALVIKEKQFRMGELPCMAILFRILELMVRQCAYLKCYLILPNYCPKRLTIYIPIK